jgi:nucleotide-binding universal stress UspA family protein
MGHIRKILVPMDGSPASIAALEEALSLADDLDAAIDVIHVDAPDRFEHGSTTAAEPHAQVVARREMEDALKAAETLAGKRLTRRTVSGEPIHTIVDVAAMEGADLIVMGTHGRVGRLHALVGSVAEGVLRNAPCPVLTVRQINADESFAERIHGRQGVAEQALPPRR